VTVLEYSRKRLEACLEEVANQKSLDFPYSHSELALDKIEDTFRYHLGGLEMLSEDDSDQDTIRGACIAALVEIFNYIPLLGFILRSTDVRNAFEIHGPLLSLSRKILGEEARLVVSSEWDYSPFTYHGIPQLPSFVLMGLPAPESANPLLLSLAGHELGHPIWSQSGLERELRPDIESTILREIELRWDECSDFFPPSAKKALGDDLTVRERWRPALKWALSHAKETFCDFVGLRLFRESFLHAFSYLLAPGGDRSPAYPAWSARVSNLVQAANAYQLRVPPGYQSLFEDSQPPDVLSQSIFLLSLADAASQAVVPKLVKRADDIIETASIDEGSEAGVEDIYNGIRLHIVPARNPVALSDILNAGWRAFHDPKLWEEKKFDRKVRERTLKELLLKSIEVLEYNTRTKAST